MKLASRIIFCRHQLFLYFSFPDLFYGSLKYVFPLTLFFQFSLSVDLFLFYSDNSVEYPLNKERVTRILIRSCEQAQVAYLPKIVVLNKNDLEVELKRYLPVVLDCNVKATTESPPPPLRKEITNRAASSNVTRLVASAIQRAPLRDASNAQIRAIPKSGNRTHAKSSFTKSSNRHSKPRSRGDNPR